MKMINVDDLEQALTEVGLAEVTVPIVDAEPVVRCKDCKFYWKNSVTTDVPMCLTSPKDDAFCSEGERGEDGKRDNS